MPDRLRDVDRKSGPSDSSRSPDRRCRQLRAAHRPRRLGLRTRAALGRNPRVCWVRRRRCTAERVERARHRRRGSAQRVERSGRDRP